MMVLGGCFLSTTLLDKAVRPRPKWKGLKKYLMGKLGNLELFIGKFMHNLFPLDFDWFKKC